MAITIEAQTQLEDRFKYSPYIGSAQIHTEDTGPGLGKHRFFYLGYHDLFGVEIPSRGRKRGLEFQIWPRGWVLKHVRDLDGMIAKARKGNFIKTRHNIELSKRAKSHGQEFIAKPEWFRPPEKKAAVKEKDKLPKRRRKRRKLKRRKLI